MILKETVQQMLDTFPGVPIFPALGNHEAVPVNRYDSKVFLDLKNWNFLFYFTDLEIQIFYSSFPPPFIQNEQFAINWLYDSLDTEWRKWLPASVSRTVRRGAFYSVLVRPGFRIISLNMNYCNNKNW